MFLLELVSALSLLILTWKVSWSYGHQLDSQFKNLTTLPTFTVAEGFLICFFISQLTYEFGEMLTGYEAKVKARIYSLFNWCTVSTINNPKKRVLLLSLNDLQSTIVQHFADSDWNVLDGISI